jgi:hypothetical protein
MINMKQYSNNRAHKGRVAYRTPSRWLAGRPEHFKKIPTTKLVAQKPWSRQDSFSHS